jgi:hypothetical protein
MEETSNYSVPAVAYVLQSRTSTVAERITALRSLKRYLETSASMDAYSKKRIKQLILDNALQMILSEERVTNIVKRQMVRTELFLILANLLDSSVLFGSIFGTEVPHPHDVQEEGGTSDVATSSRVLQPPGGWVKRKLGKDAQDSTGGEKRQLLSQSASAAQLQALTYRDVWSPVQASRATSSSSSNGAGGRRRSALSQSTDLALLKPIIRRQTRSKQMASAHGTHTSKTWKPRPSVLHSELVADSFVPGADPLNYFEQDRKLGYQKPRMWFPGVMVSAQSSLLPDTRAASAQKVSGAEQVVQEYMQMRSLASYVGDLVAPYTPAGPRDSYMTSTMSPGKPGSTKSADTHTSRLSNLTDNTRFAAALKEIAAVWSPLLGVHLPPQDQLASLPGTARSTASRKRKLSTAAPATSAGDRHGQYQEYAQEIVPFKCLRVETAGAGRGRPPQRGGPSGGVTSPGGGSVRSEATAVSRTMHRYLFVSLAFSVVFPYALW